MAIPVTFTVRPADGGVQVTIQFGIDTEAGQRLDRAGRPVKPHFVEEVTIRHNERTVLTAYLGPAMARKPELSFRLDGARAGEALALAGRTNRGEMFEAVHRLA
jgi:sulfur-oxidizing protein SoxZ